MPTLEILKTYSVTELRKEVGKARMKNYSKLKKSEVIDLMLKNKEKFHHLKGKVKAPKATAVAKPKAVEKPKAAKKPLAKKEPAYLPPDVMNNIKVFMNVGKDATIRKMDAEKIENKLDKYEWFRDMDFMEWMDDKDPTTEKGQEAQMVRAHRDMYRAVRRVIKKTMRDKRFKTDNDVVRFWNQPKHYNHEYNGFDAMMEDPKLALPK